MKQPGLPQLPSQQLVRSIARTVWHSVLLRALLFATALWAVWHFGRPWDLGWLRRDEAQEIAESFLLRQGADLQNYTLIQAVERRREGAWNARGAGESRFAADPAVGYLLRYFRPGAIDGWTVAVSPAGQIYRVQREQLDDEPGIRLDRIEALHSVVVKLSNDLAIPAYSLNLRSDTLIFQPQRNDWIFTFDWPQALDSGGTFTVSLAGDAIADLQMHPQPHSLETVPHRTARDGRVRGFVLILAGVFLMMHYHRTPLTLRTAGMWGAIIFGLTLAARGLTFSQAVILMPADVALRGYLARVGLSALVEALQSALLLGLVIATGEALARDVFRRSSTLSRIAPGLFGWRGAWARGARWAFPAAALVLVVETAADTYFGPVGLYGKVPGMIADTLSSPLPSLALPVQILLDVVWEESLYRLWLLSLLLFWLRLPVLAIPLAAGAAAFFTGYDMAQFTSIGGIFYLAWGMIAGWLVVRSGIIAAMLFHLLVLVGHASLALIWMSWGAPIGGGLIAMTMLAIILIAWDRRPPKPAQLDILPPPA